MVLVNSNVAVNSLSHMEIKLSTEIFLCHEREIKRYLFKCTHCQSTADDLAHELLLKLHAISNLADVDNIRAYLYRMAANLVNERIRNQARHNHLLEKHAAALLPVQESHTPEDWLAARQKLEQLEQAVSELPPRCREVFLLRKIEQLNHAEIAQRLGISRSMVEKHLHKAMMHCRDRLYAP